jgi:Domain of unknown function (DUF4160)
MPRISAFYGITVWMYYEEGGHAVPHFHARYAGRAASFTVDGRPLAGELPSRAAHLLLEWAALHRDELLRNWDHARHGEPLVAVAPLP